MASTPEKHAADQAGGGKELIFSSDGLESVKIAFPVRDGAASEELDTGASMTAEQAFEVFAGRLYVPNPYAKKTKAQGENDVEGPLQRLGRLKRELDEMHEDIKDSESGTVFQEQLAQLQLQFENLSTAQLQRHQSLVSSIQKSVEGVKEIDNPVSAAAVSASATSPEIEERLIRLETALGTSINHGSKSILDRLTKLENLPLDDKKLDLVQKRVKVIRQDLEAAAKARSKLMAVSSASAEDSKSIAALYDQLQLLQGVSQHLPALSYRLQSLAHQHVDAATQATRFQAVEQVTNNLSSQVTSIEVALHTLEATLQQNATSMQQNIQALEDRMKALS